MYNMGKHNTIKLCFECERLSTADIIITQYSSTVYIGNAMVFVFSPYIREIQFILSVSSNSDDFTT